MFDSMYDIVSYTNQYMSASIAAKGLKLASKPGEDAWLTNGQCMIRLTNVENDFVAFQFHSPQNEEDIFDIRNYLDCCYKHEGGYRLLSPNPPKDLPAEQQFVSMLHNYDHLLVGGYLDAPLEGDYSWVAAYHEMLAEENRLSLARYELGRAGHPEAKAILRKKTTGDLTWMDDVRRILAEQEAIE